MHRLLLCLALVALPLPSVDAQRAPRVWLELLEAAVASPAPRWRLIDHRHYREMKATFALQLFHEFESIDWDGLRTRAIHAYEGAMIDLSTAGTLKVREGYRGWSQGKEHFTWWEKGLEPVGAAYIFGRWESYFVAPPAPPVSATQRASGVQAQ